MKTLPVYCLSLLLTSALATIIDPRGARPIEHGFKADKCDTQKEWPFCTDDDWGPKCPSGCRIQGLLDKYDHEILKKIEKIRTLLDQYQAKHRSADQVSKQTYDYLRDKLTTDAGKDNSYYDLAQNLRQRIVDMKIKIDRQLRILQAMKERVKDQVIQMHRLEVDMDIKLRSCKGSCDKYAEFSVDQDSYVALDKQMAQLEARSGQSVETVNTLYVMKSRPLQDAVLDDRFKSSLDVGTKTTAEQRHAFFPEVSTIQLTVEREGASPASPATVSKDPGTSFTSSSSSTSSSTHAGRGGPTKSITEIGSLGAFGDFFGGFFEGKVTQPVTHVSSSTKSVACTQTTRTTVVNTGSGPVERTETVTEGGPECQTVDLTKGSQGPFHSLTSSSSSSSVKGSPMDTKSGFADPFGVDLGGFMTDDGEDDVPDFHARSVKSARVERQADYVGTDCADIQRKHLSGESSGLFKVRPAGSGSDAVVEVYCHQEGLLGGWLLAQQRESGATNFNRSWSEYRAGFGRVDSAGAGELWLGNENLHLLTAGRSEETLLRVELEDWEGGAASAEYAVRVGSEAEGYPLRVSAYTGDAGDALIRGDTGGSSGGSLFLSHAGMKFSTFDRDNDRWGEESCAEMYGGGWWYNNCQSANLNGVYYRGGRYEPGSNVPYEIENGVVWLTWKPADYSLKRVRMFLRPATL